MNLALTLEEIASIPGLLLIAGDFIFQVDDQMDREASICMNLVTSAGLTQHAYGPTHKKGHTLDLILIRDTDNFVSNVITTSYLPSDHSAVICNLNIARPKPTQMKISFRKFEDIDIDVFLFCYT